jgi:hypothetical protein
VFILVLGVPLSFYSVDKGSLLPEAEWPGMWSLHFTSIYGQVKNQQRGHAVSQQLRHCATNRKVAASIPDGVTGIFYWNNPSGRTMALGSTQPLTEMITRYILWGKVGRCLGRTTLLPTCADCLKIWEPQTAGNLSACQGL